MICYKDRTFCIAHECAVRDTCPDYASKDIVRGARECGLMLSIQVGTPVCFIEKPATETKEVKP